METIENKNKETALKKIKSFIKRGRLTNAEKNYIKLFVYQFYSKKIYTSDDFIELLIDLIKTEIEYEAQIE